jgi:hypothetical protein
MEDLFQEIFDEAGREADKAYLPGAIGNAKEHHPKIWKSILFTEGYLNDLWSRMRRGENTLDQFKGAVKAWQESCLRTVELHRKEGKESEQRALL